MELAVSNPSSNYALQFEHLSLQHGLSQSTVLCIFQTDREFMWFGTRHGINRFDGYNFTPYTHDPDDPHSISNNWVTTIFEDRSGNLWVGTQDGLNKLAVGKEHGFDFHYKKFVRYRHDPESLASLSGNHITAICEDETGILWIGTTAGLNALDTDSGRITRFDGTSDPDVAFLGKIISSVIEDRDGELWIGTLDAGLSRFDKTRNRLERLEPLNNRVMSLLEDESGLIWIGTADGLSRYDKQGNMIKHYRFSLTSSLNGRNWTDTVPVATMCQDQKGFLWISSKKGHGLLKFDRKTETAGVFRHNPAIPASLSANEVFSIYSDKSGALWVGTMLGGINKHDPNKKRFRKFTRNPFHANSLSNRLVYSFYEDARRLIWVGTGDGLNIFDPAGDRFLPVDGMHPRLGQIRGNIFFIHRDSQDEFWFGTNGNGLFRITNDARATGQFRLDLRKRQMKQYLANFRDRDSPSSNSFWCVYEDSSRNLWFGTRHGLNKYDRQSDSFKRFLHDERDSTSLSDNWVRTIFQDQNGTLWIGTESGGLNRFDGERFFHYTNIPGDSTSLSHNSVTSIFEDESDNFWVATYGGGLNKFDRETGTFSWFTQSDGLSDHVIYGILADERQRLWLSTNRGLSCFDFSAGSFKNYDVDDGLQSNEFNSCAYLRRENGEMLFGGINGFNLFHPDSINDNSHRPPTMITSVSVLGKRMSIGDQESQCLELRYRDNFITFEFIALDYANPQKNRYAYKLEGFDEDWVDGGSRRYAVYTNLDPGEYTFRVKAANNDGVWNDEASALRVVVHPPLWQSWWFYTLSFSALLSAVVLLHQYRVNQRIKQVIAIERVRKKAAADFHDELGHKLTKISLFCEIIKRSLNGRPTEIAEHVIKIGNISRSLYDGMRDFLWTLDPEKDSFYEMAIRLKDFGDEFFSNTGIAFQVKGIDEELRKVDLTIDEKRHITLIFKEGMNNILKHARCRNVVLQFMRNASGLSVSLKDDGVGFRDANGFSGNGLNNITSRAQKIESSFDINSEDGKGTNLTLRTRSQLTI